MADTKKKDQRELPKEEADKRRDELAKRILRTPPDPQKRLGESKNKRLVKRQSRSKPL